MISPAFQPNTTRLYGVRVPSLPLGPRLRSFVDIFLVTREVEGQRELGVAARLSAAVVLLTLVERDVPLQTELPFEGLLAYWADVSPCTLARGAPSVLKPLTPRPQLCWGWELAVWKNFSGL